MYLGPTKAASVLDRKKSLAVCQSLQRRVKCMWHYSSKRRRHWSIQKARGGGGGDYCFSLAHILSLVSVYVTTSCFVGASILPPGKS